MAVFATDAFGAATDFACAVAGDIIGVTSVVDWAGDCAVGFFVSAWTATAFACIEGLAVFAIDALDSTMDFACAVAGDIIGVTGVVVWAGDCAVGVFVSTWTTAVLVADALDSAVGLACAAVGDIVGVGVFTVAGVAVSAGNCAAGFCVSALTSVCSSPPLGTGAKSSGFKNGFDAEA